MEYFDTHAHYDDDKFNEDREEVIEKIFNTGVTKCVNMGCDVESSQKAIEIANIHDFIYAAVGLHPEEIPQSEEEMWKTILQIKDLAVQNKKVVAIGEIGLDYYWNKENIEMQKQAFIKQIELANELKLPISIHTRDAIDDMISIIRKYKIENGGVLHCCPLNPELIKEGLKLGYYISFSGNITFKNAKSFDAVSIVPMDRILIETDAPYLSPEPFRGTRNNSINVKLVAEKIAEIKKISINEVSQKTYQNAERVYEIKM